MSDDQPRDVFPADKLDPIDWDAFARFAGEAVATQVTRLGGLRDEPAWREPSAEAIAHLQTSLPMHAQDLATIHADFLHNIAPYVFNTAHPRQWGWGHGSGAPAGMLGEMIAASLNCNVPGFNQTPVYVELQVLDWLKQMFDLPRSFSGLLVSGASLATLTALTVARQAKAGFDVRADGLAGGAPLRVYVSSEAHASARKAVETLGLGARGLCVIAADENFRMNVEALRVAIAADCESGRRPIAVVASAGTANTGAIDPLNAIADLCAEEGLWLHVDGAIGAPAWLDARQREKLSGLQRADSISLDGHKWLYQPYDLGCVFIRDGDMQRETFAAPQSPSSIVGGLAASPFEPYEFGLETSRSFRALKLWYSIRAYGVERLAATIARNIDQTNYLAERVQENAELELLTKPTLNILCYRYAPAGFDEAFLEQLNARLVVLLHERGIALPAWTRIGGKLALRVTHTNHRSSLEDFDLLVDETIAIGRDLAVEKA